MNGSSNINNLPSTLASRTMNGGNPGVVQQPTGGLSSGRFSLNNISAALSQLSHASSYGHPEVTNRGGASVNLGNMDSISGLVGGGSHGRSLSSGGGLGLPPGLLSRVNSIGNGGSGNMSAHGPNRLMGTLHSQGNFYSAAGGPLLQQQVQTGNAHMSSMALLHESSVHKSSPFDINDFPQLSGRPSSSGGSQGQLGSLRKQSVGVVQQNPEFCIQPEEFPALTVLKGGNTDGPMDLQQREQLHDNSMSMMQSRHLPMGRSGGFSVGGPYSSHHHQHPSSLNGAGVSFLPSNNQDNHLHASSLLPTSYAGHQSQVRSNGIPANGLRTLNSITTVDGAGPYNQFIQPYQQQLQSQPKFSSQPVVDQFGLLGLISIIRNSNHDLYSLALGIDLTTLGLNLNSSDDLHKKFSSPWSAEPAEGEPQYNIPECYNVYKPHELTQRFFPKFRPQTLFYIFYSMPRDEAQLYAADELHNRGWVFHRELRQWLLRDSRVEPLVKNTYEIGTYHCFNPDTWDTIRKDNFVLHYDALAKRTPLPQPHV